MASTNSLPAEDPQKAILEKGVFCAEDPVVGKRVDEIARKGFPFKTEEGLDFCKTNALDDERVRSVLKSFFEWSGLGLYKAFGRDPSHAYSFLTRIESEAEAETKSRALIVQLWSSGSRMIFYSGSHLRSLPAKAAKNGLLETPLDRLKQAGIVWINVEMKDGGLVILDGALRFTIIQGRAITFGFAAREELEQWGKMHLPNVENLKRKVAEMEGTTVGVNFDFVD